MTRFASLDELRSACLDLPGGHTQAAAAVAAREAKLTKPPGSLGRLEAAVQWLALWQGKNPPRLGTVEILVFAGNHGVTAQGVSAYPAEVTAQMVANFAAGGAAINQLAQLSGAELRVIALDLDRPTADFTKQPAMDEAEFLDAVSAGYDALSPEADIVVLGEMGIGNTTAASAIAAALFGGGGARFAGHGTGVDERGLDAQARGDRRGTRPAPARSSAIRCASPPRLADASLPPSSAPRSPRGIGASRRCSTASSARPPWRHGPSSAPARSTMRSPVTCRPRRDIGFCFRSLACIRLLDLGMRLGEGSGAAVAVLVLRAALACHTGMATFKQAQVSEKDA